MGKEKKNYVGGGYNMKIFLLVLLLIPFSLFLGFIFEDCKNDSDKLDNQEYITTDMTSSSRKSTARSYRKANKVRGTKGTSTGRKKKAQGVVNIRVNDMYYKAK